MVTAANTLPDRGIFGNGDGFPRIHMHAPPPPTWKLDRSRFPNAYARRLPRSLNPLSTHRDNSLTSDLHSLEREPRAR